jgi:hypothetical protein
MDWIAEGRVLSTAPAAGLLPRFQQLIGNAGDLDALSLQRALQMGWVLPKLTKTKSGASLARQAIPADVRDE